MTLLLIYHASFYIILYYFDSYVLQISQLCRHIYIYIYSIYSNDQRKLFELLMFILPRWMGCFPDMIDALVGVHIGDT